VVLLPEYGAEAARGRLMSEPRIIKKYPNRRLYDTVESRYITLADVRRLVLEKVDFVVIDKKSQDDITRTILLQVIAEQEHHGEPVMSRDFLSQVIRSYGGMMPAFVGSYLEQSLKLFMTQQQQVRDKVRDVVGIDPVGAVANLAQKNYDRWRSIQDDVLKALSAARGKERDKD
jgi:polyhydroxyalkanoate synthesis repressor PhaR